MGGWEEVAGLLEGIRVEVFGIGIKGVAVRSDLLRLIIFMSP